MIRWKMQLYNEDYAKCKFVLESHARARGEQKKGDLSIVIVVVIAYKSN